MKRRYLDKGLFKIQIPNQSELIYVDHKVHTQTHNDHFWCKLKLLNVICLADQGVCWSATLIRFSIFGWSKYRFSVQKDQHMWYSTAMNSVQFFHKLFPPYRAMPFDVKVAAFGK